MRNISKRLGIAIGGAAATAALVALSAGPANAATASHVYNGVSSTVLQDTNGEAGYYTHAFGDTFTAVNGVLSPTSTIGNVGVTESLASPAGGVGVQLCDSSTGKASQLGIIQYDPADPGAAGVYVLAYSYNGHLTEEAGSNDPCSSGGILTAHATLATDSSGNPIVVNPADSFQVQISETRGGLEFTVEDVTENVTSFSYFARSFNGNYNEAGAGLQADPSTVSGCASQEGCPDDILNLSDVTATTGGVTSGFASWNAVQVTSAASGTTFTSPDGSITPTTGRTCTTVKGHWSKWKHHHHHWIKKKRTCTGGGPSSFSVYTGEPTGV